MAKLEVLEIPHPILKEKALPVKEVTPEIKKLLADMLETMYKTNGVGLAGNQIGELKRVVVIDCGKGPDRELPDPIKMVNPEIIERSAEIICHNEGCLSIPREYADVDRHEWVVVQYLDENGQVQKRKGEGLLSVAFQHELDHLDGILFIDHISQLKRQRLLKHLEKRRKKAARDAMVEEGEE